MQDYGGKLAVMLLQLETLSREASPNLGTYLAGQYVPSGHNTEAHECSAEYYLKDSPSHRVKL